MKKVRIDPKERGTARDVIIVAGKEYLANLLGEHIRSISIRGTQCERDKIVFCPILERKVANSDVSHLTSGRRGICNHSACIIIFIHHCGRMLLSLIHI